MISRREILIVGGLSLAWPVASYGQPAARKWRLGFLASRRVSSLAADEVYGSLLLGLRDLGYVEGRNLVVELRSADGKADQLAAQAAELVKAKVDVIVTGGSQATSAAQKETQTIPIVMGTVSDPVGSGFVKSLGHPGGNITGLSNLGTGITSKHFELLRDMVPKMSRAALLVNSTNSSRSQAVAGIEAAGRKANVKVMRLEASTPREIERAFETMATNRIDGLIVALDSVFAQQRRQFAELGLKHRMPAIYAMREHVEAGALMSYGQNISDNFRRAAAFVDKIFKGAKAGDLPVEQSTTFELYINGKTARALGLTIPQSLLISADKVIE